MKINKRLNEDYKKNLLVFREFSYIANRHRKDFRKLWKAYNANPYVAEDTLKMAIKTSLPTSKRVGDYIVNEVNYTGFSIHESFKLALKTIPTAAVIALFGSMYSLAIGHNRIITAAALLTPLLVPGYLSARLIKPAILAWEFSQIRKGLEKKIEDEPVNDNLIG